MFFAAETGQTGSPLGTIVILLPLAVLFYFFMIRPQKRQREAQTELMRSLEIGDEIETIGGLFGAIRRLDDDHAWVEFAPGTTVKMARRAIRRKVVQEDRSGTER